MKEKIQISFVIPVFNEDGNIARLHSEIVSVCEASGYISEIIVINDGSSDRTLDVLKTLRPIKIINFRKQFGQTAALDAGIKQAMHPYIVTLDGDGQNDPNDVPSMLNFLLDHELDVVCGNRHRRQDTFGKRFVSRGANMLRKLLVDDKINDSGCTLKLFKSYCFYEVNLYGEMHRFIPALLKIQGFKIGEIKVNHRPRLTGSSKYSMRRVLRGFLDMILLWFVGKYSLRPLHLFGSLGFFLVLMSIIFLVFTVIDYANGQDLSETYLPNLTTFTFLFGLIFIIFGLSLDLQIRSYYEQSGTKPYKIKEILDIDSIEL